ncbi:MAG: heavy metal translocating P-type ATPase, partial [Alphaproteobacteria bacterium]|nr:heavy metal translocating P-type ATPase [Alphaproteobacteria bacterium]
MEPATVSDQPDLGESLSTEGFDHLARREKDGSYSLSVMVRGVHCAACIQKIEGALRREDHIRDARLNYSTGRLSMHWDGKAQEANDYVRTVESLGFGVVPYDAAEEESTSQQEERFLLLCLGVAGFAMGNIMLLSVGLWSASSEIMGLATRELFHWVSAIIALPTILFSGRPFFRSAVKVLAKGQTNMDVPISIGIILTGAMSLFGTINHSEYVYFDSAVMLIFFLLIGRYFDFRARKHARSTATGLLSALSGFAHVLKDSKIQRLPVRDLEEDMTVRVMAGEKCPVDGIVTEGRSEIDTSLITG